MTASFPPNRALPYKIQHVSPGTFARLYGLLEPILRESTAGSERLTADVLKKIVERIEREKATIDRQADSPELSFALGESLAGYRYALLLSNPGRGAHPPRILHPGTPEYQQMQDTLERYNRAHASHPISMPGLLLVADSPNGKRFINGSFSPFGDILSLNEATLRMPPDLAAAVAAHEFGHKGQFLAAGSTTAYFDPELLKPEATRVAQVCDAAGVPISDIGKLRSSPAMRGSRLHITMENSSLDADVPAIDQSIDAAACAAAVKKLQGDISDIKRAVAATNLAIGRWQENDADGAAVATVGGKTVAHKFLFMAVYNPSPLDHTPFAIAKDPHPSLRDRIQAAGYNVSYNTGGDPDSRGYVLTPVKEGDPLTVTLPQLSKPPQPETKGVTL